MSVQYDLGPAARAMAKVVSSVTDEQLAAPTPCAGTSLAGLLDHIDGLTLAFTHAAGKDTGPATSQAPVADATRLADGWRERIPARLATLADAWQDPAAWQGMTRAGGVDLPGEVCARVALNELVVHGWDVARGAGLPFDVDAASVDGCLEWVCRATDGKPGGTPGLFGPVVEIPADAPRLHQLLGRTGRDPSWRSA